MHRPIALFLCIAAQGAIAQCAAPPVATTNQPAATAATRAPADTHKSPELIKTAAASTRDDAPPVVRESTRRPDGQDHPRRGGTAMLLAALALMSGIALRRYGASDT